MLDLVLDDPDVGRCWELVLEAAVRVRTTGGSAIMGDSSRDTERDRAGKGGHVTTGDELEDARGDKGESDCGHQAISETEMGDEGADDKSCAAKRCAVDNCESERGHEDISETEMGDEGVDDESCAE